MRHFNKIPADDALPVVAKACSTLVQIYTFRMRWLNGELSGEGACPGIAKTVHAQESASAQRHFEGPICAICLARCFHTPQMRTCAQVQ